MTTVLIALGVGLLILAGLFLIGAWRHRRLTPRLPERPLRLPPQAQLARLQQTGRFRGVRIESHCAASSFLAGREYAFDAAPHLPVEGCDAQLCDCGYVGLPDRRKLGTRRSGADRRESLRADWDDRRTEYPRRKADLNSWGTYGHL